MERFLNKLSARNKGVSAPPVTVGFLGDSITQGCFEIGRTHDGAIRPVYDAAEGYPHKFTDLLRELYPAAQINLINAGYSGDTAEGGLKRVDRDLLRFEPDMAVVCFGLNDVAQGKGFLPKYEAALGEIFAKINSRNIPGIFMTPNMMNDYPMFSVDGEFADLSRQLAELQKSGVMDAFMETAVKTARSADMYVCDCYAVWKKWNVFGADTTRLLSNGLNHPSRGMHRLFAYELLKTVFYGGGFRQTGKGGL